MTEPTLYQIKPVRISRVTREKWLTQLKWDGVLVPVEPDYEAMASVMNEEGWTCDGHEPGAWCEECKRLQLKLVGKVWNAGIGGDDDAV